MIDSSQLTHPFLCIIQTADKVPRVRSELLNDAFTQQAQALLWPHDALRLPARPATATHRQVNIWVLVTRGKLYRDMKWIIVVLY